MSAPAALYPASVMAEATPAPAATNPSPPRSAERAEGGQTAAWGDVSVGAPVVRLLGQAQVHEALGQADALDGADAVHQREELLVVGHDRLDEQVEAARRHHEVLDVLDD